MLSDVNYEKFKKLIQVIIKIHAYILKNINASAVSLRDI